MNPTEPELIVGVFKDTETLVGHTHAEFVVMMGYHATPDDESLSTFMDAYRSDPNQPVEVNTVLSLWAVMGRWIVRELGEDEIAPELAQLIEHVTEEAAPEAEHEGAEPQEPTPPEELM